MKLFYDLWGYKITTQSSEQILNIIFSSKELTIINTLNPHSYVVSKKNVNFSLALKESDFLLPDGVGIILAILFKYKVKMKKISGFDFFSSCMKHLNSSNGRVFFLGSSSRTLQKITDNASREYPHIAIGSMSPPFKKEFNESEVDSFINAINKFSPDVVFVGLTAPKQEILIQKMKSELNCSVIAGIGAVFDFYAGTIKRPSALWVGLHLEWLIRLLGEPRRLWRRTFISAPIFLFDILFKKS